MSATSFGGLRVLALESRYPKEIRRLIASHGGQPIIAPALREVRVSPNAQAHAFISGLAARKFDVVIFLTGAGIRGLVSPGEGVVSPERLASYMRGVVVLARGPKPAGALAEVGIKADLVAPEPNTWREILRVVDEQLGPDGLRGKSVAIQEYGVPCSELLAGLKERGASVTRVPVYRWALPEDLAPLQDAIKMLAEGEIDVVLLTAPVQAEHLLQIASEIGVEEPMRMGMERIVIASVGPTTTEHINAIGLHADMQASRPRMAHLVEEAARRAADILREKHKEPGLDFLHEIGSRMAGSSPLREVLDRIVEFSSSIVKCDSCFVYMLESDELVLRASKNPHPAEVDSLRLGLGEGITGWVAKHQRPVAIAANAFHDPRFQFFNELPEDRYEAFLSVPILCRGKLVGVINLQHRQRHSHTRREMRLLSTIGFFVGAEIEMARLEERSSQLSDELESRKVMERAKGILQRELQVSEEEAYLSLRRQSRQLRKTMKEVAQAIIREETERSPKRSLA